MQLEQQVVSLKLAKRLKELGVKQESVWYWVFFEGLHKWIVEPDLFSSDKEVERYSAFTVAELGSLLPPGTISYFDPVNDWQCKTFEHKKHIKREWSEADARAKMFIYLLEHDLITPPSTTEVPPHAVPIQA